MDFVSSSASANRFKRVVVKSDSLEVAEDTAVASLFEKPVVLILLSDGDLLLIKGPNISSYAARSAESPNMSATVRLVGSTLGLNFGILLSSSSSRLGMGFLAEDSISSQYLPQMRDFMASRKMIEEWD